LLTQTQKLVRLLLRYVNSIDNSDSYAVAGLCRITPANLELARKSFGTDEDVIVIGSRLRTANALSSSKSTSSAKAVQRAKDK